MARREAREEAGCELFDLEPICEFFVSPGLSSERVQLFWRFLLRQYGYVGVALGVLGWVGLALRRRWRSSSCDGLDTSH